jgi:protein-disulfide isomerase
MDDIKDNVIKYGTPLLMMMIAAVIGFFLLSAGTDVTPQWDNVTYDSTQEHPSLISEQGANPEINIYYYGDFECPHCKSFENNGMQRILDNYVSTGEARLIFRPLPLLNQKSNISAQAAYHVWEENPEEYWVWHRDVFEMQGEWESVYHISSDQELVTSVNQSEYAHRVNENVQSAQDVGVSATPSIVVDGQVVTGGNYDEIEEVIEENINNSS